MKNKAIRVVHYLNQFFGGIGGEDKALVGPRVVDGPIGPGIAVQNTLDDRGKVVATVMCGDNYFAEKIEESSNEVIQLLSPYQPDVVIAGPAFDAGRYGISCGAVCKAARIQLGIPSVTGMYKESPGVELYRRDAFIVETLDSVKGMADAISKMVSLASRLAANQKIARPSEEGYFSRGIITNEMLEQTGAERVVSMLLRKLKGKPFKSEVDLPQYERVEPASGIKDINSATIALVTDGGLVPNGNPDRIEARVSTRFGSYSLKGVDTLDPEEYEVNHIGYDPIFVTQDPNRLVPVDIMRDLEKEGIIGELHETFYSTAGAVCIVENVKKMGQAIAEELKGEDVSGVILTSTWGTSTRCGAALTKELERSGLPTAHICSIIPVAQMVGSSRVINAHKIVNPVGNADLEPEAEKDFRRSIIEKALEALQADIKEQKLFMRAT